ncbi:TetR family transcriptional regulator [Belnapia sp. T18]|uniref:TetR family transcriptional regulator n=1 Tax=Belnapia arida TaxID=2804533 RepID=A0ABS1U187_9PROT|nr:TetR/AcrR family transcriptional regulator [Belnapia arida]MBL6078438.1 TetR family transcriptional regulator [Belnapia arida]
MPDNQAPRRSRDPEQTRRAILDAAIAEFAEMGFAAARVDDIAARTSTTKRMIYYYFQSKERLFATVIEEMYGGMRDAERELATDILPPVEAMRRLVEVTFDHHAAHPEFVRLVSVENILEARNVAASPTIRRRSAAVIGTLGAVLARGEREGAFRSGVDPFDLHMLISSFCFYRVSNSHTLGAIFGRDLRVAEVAAAHRRMAVEMVLCYLAPTSSEK